MFAVIRRTLFRSGVRRGRALPEKRQFVDFQNDVTVADLRTAVEEGFGDIEHAKRYTALGFGTDQGRLSNVLGAAIIGELRGEALDRVGLSRLRQPYCPVTLRSLAGLRTGAALASHASNSTTRLAPGARWGFGPNGLWMRPRHYGGAGGDLARTAAAEALVVRTSGGLADASTLGKIEIAGPDAGRFLDYVYMTGGAPRRSQPLRCEFTRGTACWMTVYYCASGPIATGRRRSTGHAEQVLSHFEYWRALEFGHRSLAISDVTEAWAVIAVAGPKSREAISGVLASTSRAAVAALRHMEFTCAKFRGANLTVLRAGFSG